MPMLGEGLGIVPMDTPSLRTAKRPGFNAAAPAKKDYRPPEKLLDFLHCDRIVLDIETLDPGLSRKDGKGTSSRNLKEGKVVGVAIAQESFGTYYPTGHANSDRCIKPEVFYADLREQARKYRGELVGANILYDLDWLEARHGVVFPNAKIRDVQYAEPLLDENKRRYNLESLAQTYGVSGKLTATLDGIYGPECMSHMDQMDPGWVAAYAVQDTLTTGEVHEAQQIPLAKQKLVDLYDIECRLIPLLLQMRKNGVRVDIDKAAQALDMTIQEGTRIRKRIREISGVDVNVNAAASIAQAFDKLSIPYERTQKTGAPSFKKDWLESHPSEIAQLIVAARAFDKIGSTFLRSYILEGHVGGRLYCDLHPLRSDDGGTVSGRFSCSNPNLQNIPSRHPILGPLCRSIFQPEENQIWGSADWSQIEYRFLVHYAALTKGIDATAAVEVYRSNPKADFHAMAAEITGLPRKSAKNVNFGVVYGMGKAKMARSLGVSLEEGEKILETFHEKAPFIREISKTASGRASRAGYIKTALGRRRRFPQWECGGKVFDSLEDADRHRHDFREQRAPRRAYTHKALNALLQGSSADLMKLAMVKMYEDGVFQTLTPLLTVHDEMNSSVPDTKEGRDAFRHKVEIMETSMKLEVPVLASAELGKNWSEAK